ncbi:hypothetical protein BGAL_0169g00110 [Botrytis galanthina]|uniref:Ubiquitin-like domain-containing protein n=1 Tax=Botrytis galanthina TaxID=278940 RepID=A0A4S8QYA9_9HELO|nr:hypothetical protein BGAL_0169g00110 [Botrytis galanthina]
MSFGWSAGDIAQAISLIVKVVKALDDGSGAPDEYRKMAVFLENINLTLKNLHVFTTLGVYPSYGDEIRRQIEIIRPPLERFIKIMKNFEPHLGSNATPGWWKNIPRKMLWTFKRSHHQLKKEIREHQCTLDDLLNRFTLEVVLCLPDEMKKLFMNTLTPQMVSALEGMLNPIRSEISIIRSEGKEHHKELYSKTEEIILLLQSCNINDPKPESKAALDAAVHNINAHVTSILGARLNNAPTPIAGSWPTPLQARKTNIGLPCDRQSTLELLNVDSLKMSDEEMKQSLRELYYMILLYVGIFLRNLSVHLTKVFEPSRALTPILIAKYHITFHDALGSPPRVLQFDVFSNFEVFKAYLIQSFSHLVGKRRVELGLYLLADTLSRTALTADTWSSLVRPGSQVEMAMVLDYIDLKKRGCPTKNCSGTLQKTAISSWQKCSSCQKEVLKSEVNGANEDNTATVWQALMSEREANQIKTDDSKLYSRRVYRLHILPEASRPPYSRLESGVGPSTMPLEESSPQTHSSFPSTPPNHLQISFNMTSPNHTSTSPARPSANNPVNNHSPSTAATSLIRPPRFYMLRAFTTRLLPLALFTVFLITGTVILIYSVVDKRVVPSNFIAGSYITIGVIILLWCLSRFILFLRESFGELVVDEAEAGLQGVNRVHVRGLWGREEGRVKKCLRWLMETPRCDGSKSPVGGFDYGNHSSQNRREIARQETQLTGEGIELRDFGIRDQDSQIASLGPVPPSLEHLSNVAAHSSKPQNHQNDLDPRNPVQQRAKSHHQTPSQTQRTPAPPPQKTRNHRAPTPNPTINTSHDRLTVHHSSPPKSSQPVSYTSEESQDVTSQTRLAPHILPLSLQINPGSINSIARSRLSKVTRPLTQSS